MRDAAGTQLLNFHSENNRMMSKTVCLQSLKCVCEWRFKTRYGCSQWWIIAVDLRQSATVTITSDVDYCSELRSRLGFQSYLLMQSSALDSCVLLWCGENVHKDLSHSRYKKRTFIIETFLYNWTKKEKKKKQLFWRWTGFWFCKE